MPTSPYSSSVLHSPAHLKLLYIVCPTTSPFLFLSLALCGHGLLISNLAPVHALQAIILLPVGLQSSGLVRHVFRLLDQALRDRRGVPWVLLENVGLPSPSPAPLTISHPQALASLNSINACVNLKSHQPGRQSSRERSNRSKTLLGPCAALCIDG